MFDELLYSVHFLKFLPLPARVWRASERVRSRFLFSTFFSPVLGVGGGGVGGM